MQTTIHNSPTREVWTKAGPIEAVSADTVELQRVEEVHSAQIGDATPMGLFGFAVGTLLIGFVMVGFTPYSGMPAVIPALFIFAGVGQFVAGLFAFAKGNAFAGSVMSSYGANNVLVSTFIWMQNGGLIGNGHPENYLLGVELCCFAYISFAFTMAATKLNWTYAAITAALIPGYALPGIRYFGYSASLGHIGGGFLILAAVLAFYAATALVVNSTHERQVFALGRVSKER